MATFKYLKLFKFLPKFQNINFSWYLTFELEISNIFVKFYDQTPLPKFFPSFFQKKFTLGIIFSFECTLLNSLLFFSRSFLSIYNI